MIEVMMHTPPTMSGSAISLNSRSAETFFSSSASVTMVRPMVTT